MTSRRILARLAELEGRVRVAPDRLTPLWWAALATLPVEPETQATWLANAALASAGRPPVEVVLLGFNWPAAGS